MYQYREFVRDLKRALKPSSLASWAEFAKPSGFSIPVGSMLNLRLHTNLATYRTNYLYIACLLCAYPLLTNWWLLFLFLVATGAFVYLFYIRTGPPLLVAGRVITRQQKLLALAAGTLVVAFFLGLVWSLLWLVAVPASVVVAHCTFRAPAKARSTDSDDEASGDEEAAFNRSAGPVPGSVSSQQRNADLAARRMKLQSKYPNLPHND